VRSRIPCGSLQDPALKHNYSYILNYNAGIRLHLACPEGFTQSQLADAGTVPAKFITPTETNERLPLFVYLYSAFLLFNNY
jgi:hypothetical protein